MNVSNIACQHAYKILNESTDCFLIDVRTEKEWKEIGIPVIDSDNLILLTWRELPDMSINQEFVTKLESRIVDTNKHLLFICKSGGRSLEAANFAINLGYINCQNVLGGFEGRTDITGWKQNNLPWRLL
jgi:rhodanese-related sulfurtransferase